MRFFASLRSADPLSRMTIATYAIVHLLLAALLVVALFGGLAFAQDAAASVTAAPATTFDFGPWVGPVLDFLAPTILGVASVLALWVLNRVSSWLGLRIDADRRAALEQALAYAVAFALEKVGDRARGGIPIDLKHDAMVTAAAYAQRSAPDAIKHFGIDSRRLADMVESRLEGLVFDPSIPAENVSVTASRILGGPVSSIGVAANRVVSAPIS